MARGTGKAYAKKQAHNGGKTQFAHRTENSATSSKLGKVPGQNAAPLPPQKQGTGTGVAGRAAKR